MLTALRQRSYRTNPLVILVSGYVVVILLGAILLMLPFSRRGPLSLLDALFTATSAVCVTGLIVKDTAAFFTPVGKGIILILIQLGGLGYMTFATFLLFFLKGRSSLRMRLAMAESYPELNIGDVFDFARRVIKLTLFFETLGVVVLFLTLLPKGKGLMESVGYAIFVSISAFCNAGFAPFSDSLHSFFNVPIAVLMVSLLIIAGGLGFIVHEDLYFRFIRKTKKKLYLHSRAVLLFTFILVIVGTGWMFFTDLIASANGTIVDRLTNSLLMAVTPRTAGFESISISMLSIPSILLLIGFMVIGGSPGGTAGGLKTTTVGGLYVWVVSLLRGREKPSLMKYSIGVEALQRALSIFILGLSMIVIATFLLTITEHDLLNRTSVLSILFEVVSAFGTVGLSFGSTSVPFVSLVHDFSGIGKGIIIFTMLTGRVGILSMATLLIQKRPQLVKYVEGRYVIG